MPIEKDIICIELVNALLKVKGNAKHSTDSDQIYHGTESLLKVNPLLPLATRRALYPTIEPLGFCLI